MSVSFATFISETLMWYGFRFVDRQASLSVGLSRQEHWSGLPLSPPGDLPDSGWNLCLLKSLALAGGSLPLAPRCYGMIRAKFREVGGEEASGQAKL